MSNLLQPGAFREHADATEEEPLVMCEWCGYSSYEDEMVTTPKGMMHETCAERLFPVDHGASIYPDI
jgi:hypothetical protein